MPHRSHHRPIVAECIQVPVSVLNVELEQIHGSDQLRRVEQVQIERVSMLGRCVFFV